MSRIEALIADPSSVFRLGLSGVLRRIATEVAVHEAGTFDETMAEVERNRGLDLLFLDTGVPGLLEESLSSGLRWLRSHASDARLIVISNFQDRREVLTLLDEGIQGCLHRCANLDQVARAVRRVMDGEMWIPHELFQAHSGGSGLASRSRDCQKPEVEGIERLSDRQREILDLVAAGKTNPQIAAIVGLSKYTVRHHVSIILSSLNVSNRLEAIALLKDMMWARQAIGPDPTGRSACASASAAGVTLKRSSG